MIKLFNSFKRNLSPRKLGIMNQNRIDRCVHEFNFDSNEEINENVIDNVMLIGMNLPDSKNLLTETAVEKLTESFKYFAKTDKISVAVLHGLGGNFCTGLEPTEKALEKSRDLMKVLNTLNKPVIASLNGYTTNFGFHLAIMCDIKVMDETALAGFGEKTHRSELQDFLLERLILTVGLSKTLELMSIWNQWTARQCYESNFVNRSVTCGCSLGQAMSWAQSIAKDPLEIIIKEKSKVLSIVKTLTSNLH